VVLAGSGLEDEFLQRAIPTDVGGIRVPIIEPSDLITAKVPGGPTEVGHILQLLEEALSQSDLVSTFEAMAKPRQSEVSR